MISTKYRSSGREDSLRLLENALSYDPLQLARLRQIDLSLKEHFQVLLNGNEISKLRFAIDLELNEHIDVAIGRKVVAQHRTKHLKTCNAVATAYSRHRSLVDFKVSEFHALSVLYDE